MNPLVLLAQPLGQAVTWALVHFLWQGWLIAWVSEQLARLPAWAAPEARYRLRMAALAVMCCCPPATLGIVWSDAASRPAPEAQPRAVAPVSAAWSLDRSAAAALAQQPGVAVAGWWTAAASGFAFCQPALLAAWLAGVTFFSLRLGLAAWSLGRLRRTLDRFPPAWETRLAPLAHRFGYRARDVLRLSASAAEAFGAGVVRPLVVLPAAWLSDFPPVAIEAIVAHELAHLARRDLWGIVFQRTVEALFFFHPAVWRLSERLSDDREQSCDALAVSATGRRLEYAQTLQLVARLSLAGVRPVAAANLRGERPMKLLDRVRLVLGAPGRPAAGTWAGAAVLGPLALLAAVWAVLASQSGAAADDKEKEPAKEVRRDGDREGEKPAAREGERREGEVRRDGDRPAPREGEVRRDGDRPREGEVRRDGDRPAAPREGEVRRDGDRPREGEVRRPDAPREGERPRLAGPTAAGEQGELAQIIRQLRAEVMELRAEVARLRGGKEGAVKAPPAKEGVVKEGAVKERIQAEREIMAARLKEAMQKATTDREAAAIKAKLEALLRGQEGEGREAPVKEAPRKDVPQKEAPRKDGEGKEAPRKDAPAKEGERK